MRQHESGDPKTPRFVSVFKAATLAAFLAAAAPAVSYAQPAGTQTPSAQATFFLNDRTGSGPGILGRGTMSFQGKDYPFKVTGLHLARTSADTPNSMSAEVYNLKTPSDAEGVYESVGTPSPQSYIVQNAKGVRIELKPIIGRSRLPARDAAHPVTITLLPPQ